ncbi:DUF6538 domain-containing protein [Acidisoma sp. C75]
MKSRLSRRSGVYWFRRRVPAPLAQKLGLSEVRRSLHTHDFRIARDRFASAWAATSTAFRHMALNPQLQSAQARALLDQLLSESVLDSPTADALIDSLAEDDGYAAALLNGALVEAASALPGEEGDRIALHLDRIVNRAEVRIARLKAAIASVRNDFARYKGAQAENRLAETEEALREAEIARRVAEGIRDAMKPLARVSDAEFTLEAPTPPALAAPPPKSRSKPKIPRLSEVEAPFLTDKTRGDGYTAQTVAQTKASLRLLMDIIGDKPLNEYTGTDAGLFRDAVLRMPNAHGKRGTHVPALEAIREADDRETRSGEPVPRLTMKTTKRHFSSLSQLWEWAKPRDYVERNIFRGFTFQGAKTKRGTRSDWSDDDLIQLLGSKFYCLGVPHDSADRWLPLIAMFSGMRLEEIASLRPVEDFELIDGSHWVMKVQPHPDGWTPKTEAGERIVPIHPVLVEFGLIAIVEARRQAGVPRMWLDLSPSGPDQKYGTAFSRRFGKLKDALGIGSAVTFHSFRHNVSTILRNTTTPEAWIDAILGHEGGEGRSMGATIYLKRIGLENLRSTVEKIGYSQKVMEAIRS